MTSTHGLLYGGFDHLSNKQVPIAEPLSENGYSTGGFHSNPYLSSKFGYGRGFDTFSDLEEDPSKLASLRRYVSNNLSGPIHDFFSWAHEKTEKHTGIDVGSYYQNATELTDEALEWVETAEEPWFLWVHYMDPHHPYVPPEEHQVFGEDLSQRRGVRLRQQVLDNPDSLTKDDWDDLIALYDSEIRYTDAQISRLINGIRNATWIVTADHGEEFYEHENFGHKNRFYEEHIHVPLLLGGTEGNDVHDQLVGLNDVPTTLLSIAGVDAPDTYRGQDFRESSRDQVLGGWAGNKGTDLDSARLMTRTDDEKYIRDIAAGTEELYDLTTDSDEQVNLYGKCDADEHLQAVDDFVEAIKHDSTASDRVEIGDDLNNRLEHLGYK